MWHLLCDLALGDGRGQGGTSRGVIAQEERVTSLHTLKLQKWRHLHHQKALPWPSLLLSCCGGSKTPPHTSELLFLQFFFFFLRELRNSSREGNISVNITAVLLMPPGLVQPSQGIKLTPRTLTELLPHKRPPSSVSYC